MIEALLIGGTNHGAVLKLNQDLPEIQMMQRQKLTLVVPNHVESQIAKDFPKDIYQRLTIDKQNRSIYVIAIVGATPNETFMSYIFDVFLLGGK